MLCLAEQVGCANFSINRCVCDDHRFRWACKEVNANTPVQLSLCLGHERIAWSNKHMYRIYCFGSQSHCTHRLDATQDIDFMCSTHVHCCHDCWVWLTIHWRRRGYDPWNACDACCQNRHMRACHHWEFAARDIASDRLDRYVFVTQDNAGHRFDLNISHRCALGFRKFLDLRLSKANIVHVASRYFLHGC